MAAKLVLAKYYFIIMFIFSSCYFKIIVAELFFKGAMIMCIMFQGSIVRLGFELSRLHNSGNIGLRGPI